MIQFGRLTDSTLTVLYATPKMEPAVLGVFTKSAGERFLFAPTQCTHFSATALTEIARELAMVNAGGEKYIEQLCPKTPNFATNTMQHHNDDN